MSVDDPAMADVVGAAPAQREGAVPGRLARLRRRGRVPAPITAIALIAAVFFMLGSIGSPLFGLSVFAGTDELGTRSPYYDAGLAPDKIQNTYTDDTYTAEFPNTLLYAQSVRAGHPAEWNPYVSGGMPLGQNPNYALFNPLTLPYYVLPGWLAPGYEKLLEFSCAILGAYLFLRRLRLGRAAGLLGGTVFAGTAFMIVWTNWPQTRVAALIPWVFWGVERLVQRYRVADGEERSDDTGRAGPGKYRVADGEERSDDTRRAGPGKYRVADGEERSDDTRRAGHGRYRLADAVLLALPIAFMLLGGFPAVTAFTLLTAAPYALVRMLAEYRRAPRRLAASVLLAGAAVVAGVCLAAIQLLPWIKFYRHWLIEGRSQLPTEHLSVAELATSFAPWTFGGVGSDTSGGPYWYLNDNMVEGLSYVGAAAVVLAVVAVALAGPGRRLLPRGAWGALVAATGGWLLLIYVGGPLRLLQHLPVFSSNFVGRARSVLGLLIAVLAAVGFELLLRRRRESKGAGRQPRRRWLASRARTWSFRYGVAVWVLTAGALAFVWERALSAASRAQATGKPFNGQDIPIGTHQVAYANRQMLTGLAFVALALVASALLYWAPREDSRRWSLARLGAAGLLPALIAIQGLTLTVPYLPRVGTDTFYPITDVQAYLATHLGHDRFAGTRQEDADGAMIMGTESEHYLRALTGHGFINDSFATLVRGIPDLPINYPTYINLRVTQGAISSPILDTLATRYFLTSPRDPVFGTYRTASPDGSTAVLTPDQPVTVAVPGTGPLRAVGFTPTALEGQQGGYPDFWVSVTVRDASGTTVATTRKLTTGMAVGVPFLVPVAADRVPAGTRLTAEVTLHARTPALRVRGEHGAPLLTTVAGAEDGLSLAYAGSSVIYERLTAQPRIRWASRTVVQPGAPARVRLLSSGTIGADQVVLDTPGPAADGRPASVRVDSDDPDSIRTTVDAQGAGYLVVADADQIGWAATVDGKPAPLVAADQGIVAVPVPAGQHVVALHYAAPYGDAGAWISLTAVVMMIVAAAADRWMFSRRADPASGDLDD